MKYRDYLINPRYWLKGARHPRIAWENFFAILRHPLLYANVCREVEGLIDHYTGTILYDSVLACQAESVNVIEVGAFKGLSTCYLSLAAAKVGKRVKTFELFPEQSKNNSDSVHIAGDNQFYSEVSEFEYNLRNHGNSDVVDLIVGDARRTMLPAIKNEGFSVAFIDVVVSEVMRDLLFQLWEVARGNEVILIHDIESPEQQQVLEEFHIVSHNNSREIRLHGGSLARLVL